MNVTLSLLNAAALVALVTFHFQGDSNVNEQVNVQAQPHYLHHQAPQFAVMTEQRSNKAVLANDSINEATPLPTVHSERWVF